MASFGEGDAVKDLMWFIGIIIVLGLLWFVMGGPVSFERSGSTASSTSTSSVPKVVPWYRSGPATAPVKPLKTNVPAPRTSVSANNSNVKPVNPNDSIYKGKVSIALGQSAENTNSTNKEYVTLRANNNNKTPIVITGWKIDNGQNNTYSDSSGQLVRRSSAIVTIPSGTKLLTGVSRSALSPIALNPGDTAYVITGGVIGNNPYTVDASFLVNKCSGYLNNLDGYNFTPRIGGSCPRATDEVNLNGLPQACYNFINSNFGSSCRTPKITTDPKKGTLVNGQVVSSVCQNLAVQNFSYGACLSEHLGDKDFYKNVWYVFLRLNTTGIWARNRSTITLYDSAGKIVSQYSN